MACPANVSSVDFESEISSNDISQKCYQTLRFTIERDKLKGKAEALCRIKIHFDNGRPTFSNLKFITENVDGKGFEVIDYLGREGAGIKAFSPMEKVVLYPAGKELASSYLGPMESPILS